MRFGQIGIEPLLDGVRIVFHECLAEIFQPFHVFFRFPFNDIEQLINGSSIKKMIHPELTYRDLDSDPDNLWSILWSENP